MKVRLKSATIVITVYMDPSALYFCILCPNMQVWDILVLSVNSQATQQSNLTVHTNSKHAGIRYPCTECPDRPSFTQKGDLKKHTDSKHLGVKYPCTECDYQATQQANLKTHFDSKHAGVRYPCDQCEYKATTQVLFKQYFLRDFEWFI